MKQRADGVAHAEARVGGIDILVNNAAIDCIEALDEQEEEDGPRSPTRCPSP